MGFPDVGVVFLHRRLDDSRMLEFSVRKMKLSSIGDYLIRPTIPYNSQKSVILALVILSLEYLRHGDV